MTNNIVLRRGRGWWWTVAKYGAIFRTKLASSFAYAGDALFRTLFLAIILFIFSQLWKTTYSGLGAHRIAGFTIAQMIWYLVLTEAITLSRSTVNTEIDDEVRSGSLAYSLGRPYHYLLYHLANHLGDRLPRIGISLVVGGVIAMVLVGPIHETVLGLTVTAVSIILAVLVDFAGVLGIGLLAFWIEDTRGVALIHGRATMILGGMLLPPSVFPPALAKVCAILPFSSVYFLPGRLLATGVPPDIGVLLGKQVAWIMVLGLIALAIYRKGVAHVESNGG